MKKLMIATTLLLTLSACMTTRHYVNAGSVAGTRAVVADNHYYISGLGQKKEISAMAVCGHPSRVAATETRQSPVNLLLGFVTLGIYTPQEHTIYCR